MGLCALRAAVVIYCFIACWIPCQARDRLLRAEKIMIDHMMQKSKATGKIHFAWNRVIDEVLGDNNGVTSVRIKDVNTNKTEILQTNGVFIAAGPDLAPGARADGVSVLDLAPTVLYALGLPAGEDFAGRARDDLFTAAYRARHPLWTVPSWGTMASWRVESSPVDAKLLEELRALGYVSSP